MSELPGPPALLERYRRLLKISTGLASTLDLDTLLSNIVQAAADLCQGEAASILLYDERKRELRFQAASNLSEPLMRGLVVPVEGSLAGWMLTNRQPVLLSDTQGDPRHFKGTGESLQVTTTSLLGVPLIHRERVIGVLEVINKQAGQFTPEDQGLLEALGAQAAVAIENARLFNQTDMISVLVHELRTPMSSLTVAAQILQDQSISCAERDEMAGLVYIEANRLNELSTAFLDLSRLESGRVQLQMQEIRLTPLLEHCAAVMQPRAFERQISLQTSVSPDLPIIIGDPVRLEQAVLNLLSNAIKYNRPGGKVDLEASPALNEIAIRVCDTGYGISQEDQEHLFEKFFRAPSTEHTETGTGLGLSITKSIVAAHHGRIEVASQAGEGSQFSIYLPLA